VIASSWEYDHEHFSLHNLDINHNQGIRYIWNGCLELDFGHSYRKLFLDGHQERGLVQPFW
jgi:hypothetical protein